MNSLPADVLIHCIAPYLVLDGTVRPGVIGAGYRLLQLRKWTPQQAAALKRNMTRLIGVPRRYERLSCHARLMCAVFGVRTLIATREERSVAGIYEYAIWSDGSVVCVKAYNPLRYLFHTHIYMLSACGRHWVETCTRRPRCRWGKSY